MGDRLDVHAAFRGDHESDARGLAIHQSGEIELLLDVGAVLDVQTVDLLARRAGLDGDEGVAEHLLDEGLHLLHGLGEAHAALFASGGFLELALAAATRVNLGFDDPQRAAKLVGGGFRLGHVENRHALGDGHAELLQDRLCLILMNVHRASLWSAGSGSGRNCLVIGS